MKIIWYIYLPYHFSFFIFEWIRRRSEWFWNHSVLPSVFEFLNTCFHVPHDESFFIVFFNNSILQLKWQHYRKHSSKLKRLSLWKELMCLFIIENLYYTVVSKRPWFVYKTKILRKLRQYFINLFESCSIIAAFPRNWRDKQFRHEWVSPLKVVI